jgi:CheY-like chemotaxis protein
MGQARTLSTDIHAMIQTEVAAQPMRAGSVLLVEDDLLQLDAMIELVTDLGFKSQVFSSAGEALRFLQDRPDGIQLLWTDFRTPGQITGGDLATKALSMIPCLPIIVTSDVAGAAYKSRIGDHVRIKALVSGSAGKPGTPPHCFVKPECLPSAGYAHRFSG